MNNTLKKVSPFAVGLAFCCYQSIQLPIAQAASLSLGSDATATTVQPAAPDAVGASNCLLKEGQAPTAPEAVAPSAGLGYQSEAIAQLDTAAAPLSANVDSASSTLIAQAGPVIDDCCDVGGTATCEVGGLPVGGAALGLAPLFPLLGVPPAVICAIACSGSKPPPTPVPETPWTEGLVAGFGIFGLWYSRRFRTTQAPSTKG